MAFLAIAVSPLCLSAENYYTKASGRKDVYAVGGFWADVEGTVSPDAPSPGNDYYVVTNVIFNTDGVFCGDSLSLGLPSDPPDGTAPAWAISSPAISPYVENGTYTINDLRLYSGTIYVRSDNKYDFTIAGTATVYSVSADDVALKVYRNQKADSNGERRSMNLASTLKGESDAVLTLNVTPGTPGPVEWDWPAVQAYLVLSGDFSEYHGRFYMKGQGGLILLNTPTAFGCETDGAKANVYTVIGDAIMAVAADKSTSMSRTRGVTIYRTKTLTLTTTDVVDEALPHRGDYSGYTVTFPISGETSTPERQASTTLVKSGEGTVTLDCDCNVGTVRVDVATLALGPNFVSSTYTPNLVLAAGTQIALADGALVQFASVTVNGEPLSPGLYTGAGGPASATPVLWISGTGVLLVPYSGTPSATVADRWTATGSAGEMSDGLNWGSGSDPDFTTGEFLPTFADAGSGAVVDGDSIVKGILFDAPNDFTLSGSGILTVLGGGITAAAEREYTVAAPLFAGLSQTWDVGEDATFAVSGSFDGPPATTVTKTGAGTLDISGTNLYAGALAVTKGILRLSGVFGRSAATDGALTMAFGATNIFAGVTVNKSVTHNIEVSPAIDGEFTAEAGTTNVFKGSVSYQFKRNINSYLGDGAVVVYEKGLQTKLTSINTSRSFTFRTHGTVTKNPVVRFCGEPSEFYSSIPGYTNTLASYVTLRFETQGNIIQNYNAVTSSRLEATVDNAWNGMDGAGLLIRVTGSQSVIDVGSTRQCIQNVTFSNTKFTETVVGNGGTLEIAPIEDTELSLTNLLFTESVSLQKHGAADLTLYGGAVESYGDVAVTNGVLEFAAGATWLNGTNVTVSGSGTLKLNAANTFNRDHAVIRFADSGAINVPPGVTQVFAEGWDGDKRMRGIYTSGRVTGGGAIQVGPVTGLMIFVR